MTEAQIPGRGRPRDPATDATIIRAAVELMGERGLAGTTLSAVARRAGVARATVYLRWPNRDALVGAAAKAASGGRPFQLGGEIARDVEGAADFIRTVVSSGEFRAVLPSLVAGLLRVPPEVEFDIVAPNRTSLADEYRRMAAVSGFDATIDPQLPFDMLLGAALAHLLATGRGPGPAYARQLSEVIIRGLRAPAGTPAL